MSHLPLHQQFIRLIGILLVSTLTLTACNNDDNDNDHNSSSSNNTTQPDQKKPVMDCAPK